MGWWSCDIMGGDTPYDAHGWIWDRILELLGKEGETYSSYVLDDKKVSCFDNDRDELREAFTPENVKILFEGILAMSDSYDRSTIYAEVLALMIVESGAGFPDDLRQKFIEVIAQDSWAKEDEERARFVLDLCMRIAASKKGEVVELPKKGLFEKMLISSSSDAYRDLQEELSLTEEDCKNPQFALGKLTNGK